MDMSWQTALALTCAAVLAAAVPGTLGYTTARLEKADSQHAEVLRLRAEIRSAERTVRQVPAPCVDGRARNEGRTGAEELPG
ncbi:hypothetical protein Skr01_32160 [Sphaerisporangium krabiense]|uniref:Uncharacterized protein n=1 Tax=Sphaerisporangium krabiense TaxID=763782 RepID=A0A7W9DNZ3_9ACTN|nr:hypothetical protein [Sphaerisporangium krabiense]MBB5625539.1 hypothetical protein [Sphaerisporangium krabiense]GII63131.1 hypothetical protein Skr01_32160 [Sphaerisporangium krabiense]